MDPNNALIWQALGMGPQWHLKIDPGSEVSPNEGFLVAGNFELADPVEGSKPEGQTGMLLLNMLAAISMPMEKIVFLPFRPSVSDTVDLKDYLKRNPFSHAILLGDEPVQALFGGQACVGSHHGSEHFLNLSVCNTSVVVLPALTELIAQPALKAKAWESLCLIRDRFLLPH